MMEFIVLLLFFSWQNIVPEFPTINLQATIDPKNFTAKFEM
jgi:hypothetical protein